MGFDPASMALISGVGQGIMGYMGGMSASDTARQNALINRQWAVYTKDKTVNEILSIRAEEKRAKFRQELMNNQGIGSFVATLAGASGASMQGSAMDALASTVDMAFSKISQIGQQSQDLQASAQNKGNETVWKYETQAQQYDHESDQLATGAMFSLVGGVFSGFTGASSQNADWSFSDIWEQNTWLNPVE